MSRIVKGQVFGASRGTFAIAGGGYFYGSEFLASGRQFPGPGAFDLEGTAARVLSGRSKWEVFPEEDVTLGLTDGSWISSKIDDGGKVLGTRLYRSRLDNLDLSLYPGSTVLASGDVLSDYALTSPDGVTVFAATILPDDASVDAYVFSTSNTAVISLATGYFRTDEDKPVLFGDSGGSLRLPMRDGPLFRGAIWAPSLRHGLSVHARIESGSFLTSKLFLTDADLLAFLTPPASGEFFLSFESGLLLFSQTDVDKATPGSASYKRSWLGFDFVLLPHAGTQGLTGVLPSSSIPVGGYLPRATGLTGGWPGQAGLIYENDGVGVRPLSPGTPGARPSGIGLITGPRLGLNPGGYTGDLFFVAASDLTRRLSFEAVEFDDDLKSFYSLRKNQVQVSLQTGKIASREPVLFVQARLPLGVAPPQGNNSPALISWNREFFDCSIPRTFSFSIAGVFYTGVIPVLGSRVTATQLAAALNSGFSVSCFSALNGHVIIQDVSNTSVEICFNPDPEDFSGHELLGLPPGWIALGLASGFNPLGLTIGLWRANDDVGNPDYRAWGVFDDEVLAEYIPQSPFFRLGPNALPRIDVPGGYGPDEYFKLVLGIQGFALENYEVASGSSSNPVGFVFDFENYRLTWSLYTSLGPSKIATSTSVINLPPGGLFLDSLSSTNMEDPSYGLFVFDVQAGAYIEQIIPGDALAIESGASAQLTDVTGQEELSGFRGVISPAGFTDADYPLWSATTASVGDVLLIENSNTAYRVASLLGASLVLDPVPSTSDSGLSWKLLEGFPASQYDPGIICDVKFVSVPTTPEPSFSVRVLSLLDTSSPGYPIAQGIAEGIQAGRLLEVRYGLESTSDFSDVVILDKGITVADSFTSVINLPASIIADVHYQQSVPGNAYFSLRVANTSLAFSVVTVFTGAGLEVGQFGSAISGLIQCDSALITAYAGNALFYDQEFLAPSALSANQAELDAATGEVNVPAAYVFVTPKYIVEYLVPGVDTDLNPIGGSVYLRKPVRTGQIIEASYYKTDTAGTEKKSSLITEFLPVFVRLETLTQVTSKQYSFNPAGKTVDQGFTPQIWVGSDLQNYSGIVTASPDYASNLVDFTYDVPAGSTVTMTYAVYEALGGEQAFTVSQPPVWQPPFWIYPNQSSFTLEGDRTGVISVGCLILVGGFTSYVQSVSLNPSGQTDVVIAPASSLEVGSRSPGRDPGLQVSDRAILGNTGFMQSLASPGGFSRTKGGASYIFVDGDVTSLAKPNHILQLTISGGSIIPYLITGSEIVEGGRYTKVSLGSPTKNGYNPATTTLAFSVRPVYPQNPTAFNVGPLASTEATIIRFSATGLGRALESPLEYAISPSGDVTLQTPTVSPLEPLESLYGAFTKARVLSPVFLNGGQFNPGVKAGYLTRTNPSESNRLLGAVLRGSYQYFAPDRFTIQSLLMSDFLGEVAIDAAKESDSGLAPINTFPLPAPQANSVPQAIQTQNPRNTAWDALNYDAGARIFLSLYNQAITAFEQILENISGGLIGDRDGKFRFELQPEGEFPVPGGIYDLTSQLNPRLIWREVLDAYRVNFNWFYDRTDPVFDPRTGYAVDPVNRPGQSDGLTPDPDTLDFFLALQKPLIRNDVDDVVLEGFGKPVGRLISIFPKIDVPGVFSSLFEPSQFSRIFPEQSRFFLRLNPGLGYEADPETGEILDPGFYSAGRLIDSSVKRTRNRFIGQMSNPVFGAFTLVSDTTARPRGPRARLWAYFPAGSASLDAALVAAGITGTTLGRAAFIVTPLFLNEFIIDQTTGFPDFAQLITQGGDLPDANSGDPELSTPGFIPGDQIIWGRPDTSVYSVYGPEVAPGFRCSVLVDEVLGGAVILVKDPSGNPLSGSQILFDSPAGDLPEREDTIFTPSSQAKIDPGSYSDPPTIAQGVDLAKANGDYRIQTDLKVRSRKGQLLDASLPVEEDIWGLPVQEWSGQNPPRPMTCVEGEVEFANREINPVEIPALKGEAKDDSGDCQIPYLGSSYTEIQLLSSAEALLSAGLFSDTPPVVSAVYPDEISLADGEIYGAVTGLREPGVLYTIQDFTPLGAYVPHSGVGNVDRYDLLLVQTGQSPAGICGIQSVGDVTTDSVEPPRFITHTRQGDTHKYTARNLFAHKGAGLTGLRITELGVAVTFDFSNVPGIILDDGSNTGVGGLDTLVNLSPGNAFVINVYDPNPLAVNAYLGSVTINNTSVLAPAFILTGAGAPVPTFIAAPGWFLVNSSVLQVSLLASVLGSLGLVSGQNYDFTITLDTYCDNDTANVKAFGSFAIGSGAGSIKSGILGDRLTFREAVSFASAQPRNTLPANSDPTIELGLQFNLWESPISNAGTASNVNAASNINGGSYLTFVNRTYGVGQFTSATAPGAGDEFGTVRAMAWEGNNNTAITASGLVVSALPSSPRDENGFICFGSGAIPDPDNTLTLDEPATWITGLSVILGSDGNIQSGDIVTVADGDALGVGAVKSGTYLVRHVIPDDGLGFHAITQSTAAGSLGAFALKFPVFKSCNAALLGGSAVLAQVQPATHSPTGCVYAPTGYLYAILNDQWATWDGAAYTVNADSVYRVAYTAVTYDPQTQEATFTLAAVKQKADGSALTAAVLNAAIQSGITRASGFTVIPVRNLGPEMPQYGNVVGLGTGTLCGGFQYITIGNRTTTGALPSTNTWQSGVDIIRQLTGAVVPGANQIGLRLPNPDSNNFHAERDYVVYGRSGGNFGDPVTNPIQGVVSHMDLSQITWDLIHFTGIAPANNLDCLLPGDEVVIGDDLDLSVSVAGFYALSGVFLEPSFARPVTNLNSATPHVTSASYSPTIGQVGVRPSGGNETVLFQVRRVRRWHEVSTDIYSKISGLRYAYEIRRGNIPGLIATPTTSFTSLTGTQLGFFTDPLVNINAGDVLRVLDANGALLDSAEIAKIQSQTELILKQPGLTQDLTTATKFEVYLQSPPVPHEQSCAQLVTSLVNSSGGGAEIANVTVDYSSYPFPSGGTAPDWGLFLDDVNLDATKVQIGDYLIVDPAGVLLPASGESGSRPLGDRSVITRPAYLSGRPSITDDNRGFYKITGKDTTTIPGKTLLVLDGASRFAGGDRTGSDDILFGDASSQYALLPTVHGSLAEAGQPREGQNILRITAPSVAGVFSSRAGNALYASIEPFGYMIIRPSGIYSQAAIETALFNRERVLSWMEVLENAWALNRGGDYWVFQDEDHIDDLPSPTDDTVGAGVLTNLFVTGIRGLISQAPFESDSDGLSVLDRRVSVRDYQLDSATPPGSAVFYTALSTNALEQRPVLVDAIDDVLSNDDDFRGSRYAWLAYRTNRENGTLTRASSALKSVANSDKARRLASKRR